uniref:Uncharacterized protein n=1 Tax=Timema poppense TaxID=170557 RepID=A0A7R9H2P7_TIMPO|nr:unnamed protein product [Timema poppensis]
MSNESPVREALACLSTEPSVQASIPNMTENADTRLAGVVDCRACFVQSQTVVDGGVRGSNLVWVNKGFIIDDMVMASYFNEESAQEYAPLNSDFIRGLTEYPRKPHSMISLRRENTLIPQTDESTLSNGRAVLTHSDLPNTTTQTLTEWRLVFYTSIGMVLLPYILYLIFGSVKEQDWNKSVEETKPNTSLPNNDMPSMYVTCETSLHVKQARVSLNGDGRSNQQALPGETFVTAVKGREVSGGTPLFLLGPALCNVPSASQHLAIVLREGRVWKPSLPTWVVKPMVHLTK